MEKMIGLLITWTFCDLNIGNATPTLSIISFQSKSHESFIDIAIIRS